MRKSERDKRTYLIIGLCAVLVVMVVGFAAFSSQLQINGTSNISSNWDVHIKDNGVTYKNAVDATSTLAEKTSNLVATFACSLITPGKSTISYDVVVENKGTLNAKLDSINLTGGNSAIAVVTSPTNASLSTSPIVLAPNDETTITVTVSYNDINNQPTGSGLTTNITAQLNFSQTNDSPAPVTPVAQEYYIWDEEGHGIGDTFDTSGLTPGVFPSEKNVALKYVVEDGQITEAYACTKFSFLPNPVCLRGGGFSSTMGRSPYYQDHSLDEDLTPNKEIIEGLATIFEQNEGSCYAYSDSSSCQANDLNITANSNGHVQADESQTSQTCTISNSGKRAVCTDNSGFIED